LELMVGAKGARGYPVTTIRSFAGDADALCTLDPTDRDLGQVLGALENRELDAGGLSRLGDLLFRALLVGDITSLYRSNLNVARTQGKRLLICLRIKPPELAALPWEYMYDAQEETFLAISPQTILLRHVPLNVPSQLPPIRTPLRVLVLIASPRGAQSLNVEQEKAIVQEALAEQVRAEQVEISFLERATVAGISQMMRRFRPHVFHFVGHGQFGTAGASLLLEDQDGNGTLVDERVFREFFAGSVETRLVVLNACQTATVSSSQPLVGLAPRILQRQIPAVVAMQYPLLDRSALIFSREFYRSLALAYPIGVAVSEARKGIYMEMGAEELDWGSPVLFARTPDSVLWRVAGPENGSATGRLESTSDPIEDRRGSARTGEAVHGGSGVTIGGHAQVTIGGNFVAGNQTVISGSDVRVAGRDLGRGQIDSWKQLVAKLEKIGERLDQLAESAEIDKEEAILAGAQVQAAISNAGTPAPDPAKIAHRLKEAQQIIGTSTAGALVADLESAIEWVRQCST
jgi:hypothetical protein